MIKYYYIYPPVHKILSLTSIGRKLYRLLANSIGGRLRAKRGLHLNYVEQGRRLVHLLRRYCDIKTGDSVLELGTGWMHWYATFVRLFHDVETTLFDVWDNRQLCALKRYVSQLPEYLTEDEMADVSQTVDLIRSIDGVETFEQLYEMLDFKYVIEPSGRLSGFADGEFDVAFSCAVFEHIDTQILSGYLCEVLRVLRPGGYSVQIIDIGDHYHYLDAKDTHFKEYLGISDRLWTLYFSNKIHYINRLQASEWLRLFDDAGFELVYKQQLYTDIDTLRVSKDYAAFTDDDLRCHQLIVVHQKPFEHGRNSEEERTDGNA